MTTTWKLFFGLALGIYLAMITRAIWPAIPFAIPAVLVIVLLVGALWQWAYEDFNKWKEKKEKES
jgi:protein-S-isoprenylcysteine O-methyltransferase Ste14